MKKTLARTFALILGTLFVTHAHAGFQSGQEVVFGSNFADGDVGFVHNTSDATQYIGCEVGPGWAYCYATRSDGTYHACSTSDPDLITAATAVNSTTYLTFYWDSNGACTSIEADNGSTTAPKMRATPIIVANPG
jgi:hypothetical protein